MIEFLKSTEYRLFELLWIGIIKTPLMYYIEQFFRNYI